MLKLFSGMVIGSLITMMLLGGATAAEKVLQNAQATFQAQSSQGGSSLTIYLLAILILSLVYLASSNSKLSKQNELVIKKLRRHNPPKP